MFFNVTAVAGDGSEDMVLRAGDDGALRLYMQAAITAVLTQLDQAVKQLARHQCMSKPHEHALSKMLAQKCVCNQFMRALE